MNSAIADEIEEAVICELDPFQEANQEKYFSLFWSDSDVDLSMVEEKVRDAAAPFTDYNIHLLDKPTKRVEAFPFSLEKVLETTKGALRGRFLTVDERYHKLPNFTAQIQAIGKATMEEEKALAAKQIAC